MMAGQKKTAIRYLVLIFSFVMFCIQCETAITNLISPPTVDSTTIKNIEDVELPVITLCPVNQTNQTALDELNYSNEQDLLSGNTIKTSWGNLHNLTHGELLNKTFNFASADRIMVFDSDGDHYIEKIVYMPKYGFCKEISNYSTANELFVMPSFSYQDIRVFITDKNFRSYISPDFSSHKGSPIIVRKGQTHMYDVDLEVISSCQVVKEKVDKDDFKKCVDEEIQALIGKPLGCVPPWMSPHNQCNGTYDRNFVDKFIPKFWKAYINPPMSLRKLEIETKCRKYCSTTSATVQVREKIDFVSGHFSEIYIAFNQQVKEVDEVFNYGLFQFTVDVGSSFGLWLGLSILGLYDLGIDIMDFFLNIGQKIKKVTQ